MSELSIALVSCVSGCMFGGQKGVRGRGSLVCCAGSGQSALQN